MAVKFVMQSIHKKRTAIAVLDSAQTEIAE